MIKIILHISVILALSLAGNVANAQFGNAEDKIWEIVKKQYPDDVRMQELQFNKQKDAFVALFSVKDYEVKRYAERKHIDDYVKQLEAYNRQLDAKMFMQTAPNKKAKDEAAKMYPADYEMQKIAYGELTK